MFQWNILLLPSLLPNTIPLAAGKGKKITVTTVLSFPLSLQDRRENETHIDTDVITEMK